MQALLEHFITQSTVYSLMAVVLVAFLESLALVGLILPGTVLMAGLGALIGSGELSFWHAWLAGIVGCLLGDWISFWLGWPIINPPQSAILGMHAIKDRPMAVNGQVEILPMMYLALSYDHRLIDGRESVGFLVTIKELLEDPTRLLLDV